MGYLNVRLDDEFLERLKLEAKTNKVNLSDLVRSKLTHKNKINKICLKEINYELNRIGNNLNQITKYIHIKKMVDAVAVKVLLDIKSSFDEILDKVRKSN